MSEITNKDIISHFVLRLVYCRSEELRNWFLSLETTLFRYRYRAESYESQRLIMSEFNITNKAIGHAEYEDMTDDCYPELMRAADLFNPQLVQIFNELNSEAGSDVFIAANAFKFHMDFITNPQAYGFVMAKVACCGQGPYNGIGLCTVVLNLCPNRDEYAFWDPFHPREKANRIIMSMIMTGSTDYIYPMNLSTILAMDART